MSHKKHYGHHKPRTGRARNQATTKVCLHFLEGRCNWGQRCKFAHDEVAEAPTSFDPSNTRQRQRRRRGRRSRHAKAYNNKHQQQQEKKKNKHAAPLKTTSTSLTVATPHRRRLLSVLCVDNLTELFYFLSVTDLGTVASTCSKWNHFQSSNSGSIGSSLWRSLFTSLFRPPTTKWSFVIKSSISSSPSSPGPKKEDDVDWKNLIHRRTVEQKRWLVEAGYDHAVHERQNLHVGRDHEFSTLDTAVQSAGAFDRIIVHSGDYSDEMVRIRVSVEIVGAEISSCNKPISQVSTKVSTSPSDQHESRRSPVSVIGGPLEDVDPVSSLARSASTTTFAAVLGKLYIYPGVKVRFSNVCFGGDDSVVSFNSVDDSRRLSHLKKGFCQFDECAFNSTLFVYEQSKHQVRLNRCIIVACDSVLMGRGGGDATVRPFGLDLPYLDDEPENEEESEEMQHVGLANFRACYGLP
jgi:hypothetical protein